MSPRVAVRADGESDLPGEDEEEEAVLAASSANRGVQAFVCAEQNTTGGFGGETGGKLKGR